MKALAGKVAIVTGGASGIGRALCDELARRGCEVIVADRQTEMAQDVAASIRASGGRATPAALDVRDARAFAQLVNATVERTKRIDYLFNNAGICVTGEIELLRQEDWDDVIDVNLRGVVNGIQAVYPRMIAQRSGHIVNTASMAGLMGTPAQASYVATKHAVVGISKTLRVEAAQHGVRASVLCPGAVRTPILGGGRFGRIRIPGVDGNTLLKMAERLRPMPAEAFAAQAIDAVLANDAIIVLPKWYRAAWMLERLMPQTMLRVGAGVYGRMRREVAAVVNAAEKAPATRRSERPSDMN